MRHYIPAVCIMVLTSLTLSASPDADLPEPNPLTIYLIRHGETDWNLHGKLQGDTDNPLNSTGKRQALENAARLRGVDVDHIYSSGLKRAIQTAEVFAVRAPVTSLEQLNERSRGVYEGRIADEVEKEFRPRFLDPEDDLNGGESLASTARRVSHATRDIVQSHPGGTVMIVGHSGINPLIIAELTGMDPGRALAEIRQGNDEVFKITVYSDGHAMVWKMVDIPFSPDE